MEVVQGGLLAVGRNGMLRDEFENDLQEATRRVITFTRRFVIDELPDQALYLIRPNASYDGRDLIGDEIAYPEDSLPDGQLHLPATNADGVVAYLWRRNCRVPNWINVHVVGSDPQHTFVFLRSCGRFTAGETLYHRHQGIPPFNVLGPGLPKAWSDARQRDVVERQRGADKPSMTIEQMVEALGKFPLVNQWW